jgi:hypothetical protein
MSLHTWIDQGTSLDATLTTGQIDTPVGIPSTSNPRFTFNPFPYLPPELIVSILSHTPAESIPQIRQTDHFFRLHIDIYQRQLFIIRTKRFPREMLAAYTNMYAIDFTTIYTSPTAWQILQKFEEKAHVCLSLQELLACQCSGDVARRFYRAFLRQWESRRNMFFPKEQWQDALIDRFHIYEDCARSEICDIVHLQMLYRNVLARLPWREILPGDLSGDGRVHWSFKSESYRNVVDQVIGCGPEFIVYILSLPQDVAAALLGKYLVLLRSVDSTQLRFCCFDDVMAKLLTRLDGGSQAATRWQEEESYFDICAATNWFQEGDVRVLPVRNRM